MRLFLSGLLTCWAGAALAQILPTEGHDDAVTILEDRYLVGATALIVASTRQIRPAMPSLVLPPDGVGARHGPGKMRTMPDDCASVSLAAEVNRLIAERGLDPYLRERTGLPEAIRATERYGYLRDCTPTRTAELHATLTDQRARLRRQLVSYQALQSRAQRGRAAWVRWAEIEMAV
ncbi:MAG: hypothetical protein Kow0013_02060 [Pararhodobacter sp.]